MRPPGFYTKHALSNELGQTFVVRLVKVLSVKTGKRCIMPLDELSFEMCLERRTTRNSSSRRIIRLVSVFILEKHNQTNYKCVPKFVRTDNASLVLLRGFQILAKQTVLLF